MKFKQWLKVNETGIYDVVAATTGLILFIVVVVITGVLLTRFGQWML